MATREIWHEVLINTPAEALYRSLTEPQRIAHWWTTGVRGSSEIGRQLEFWFGDFLASIAEVTALEPGRLVHWRVVQSGVPDWLGTEIDFNIFNRERQTFLHFRHSGWAEDAQTFPHCSLGWAIFLISLKEFSETGKGRPYPFDMPINMWTPSQ